MLFILLTEVSNANIRQEFLKTPLEISTKFLYGQECYQQYSKANPNCSRNPKSGQQLLSLRLHISITGLTVSMKFGVSAKNK